MVSFRGFDTWIDLATASRVAWLVGRGKDWLRNRQNLIVKKKDLQGKNDWKYRSSNDLW